MKAVTGEAIVQAKLGEQGVAVGDVVRIGDRVGVTGT